jgi:hypothetical protein
LLNRFSLTAPSQVIIAFFTPLRHGSQNMLIWNSNQIPLFYRHPRENTMMNLGLVELVIILAIRNFKRGLHEPDAIDVTPKKENPPEKTKKTWQKNPDLVFKNEFGGIGFRSLVWPSRWKTV